MIWRAPAITGFAETAGWRREPLAVAVAVALAASHGDDAYIAAPYDGSQDVSVGLWQIPTPRADVDTVHELCDPYRNAQAARERWGEAGESWDWCDGWRTGRWGQHLAAARETVASGVRADTVVPFGTRDT